MQRNISRRDFGKRLAGGAAFLVLQPASNYLAAAQSLRNDLKDLQGGCTSMMPSCSRRPTLDTSCTRSQSQCFGPAMRKPL